MTAQVSLVERTDGGTALFDVDDASVADNGALVLRGDGYATIFAAHAWASITSVPADTEEAQALAASYRARPLRVVPSAA